MYVLIYVVIYVLMCVVMYVLIYVVMYVLIYVVMSVFIFIWGFNNGDAAIIVGMSPRIIVDGNFLLWLGSETHFYRCFKL